MVAWDEKKFIDHLRSLGLKDELIGEKWDQIRTSFMCFLLEAAYELLPEDKQRELEFGLPEKQDVEGITKFIKILADYFAANPESVDWEKAFEPALKMFDESVVQGVKLVI